MKLRYIIPMFVAAVATMVSCSDDDEKSYLSEITVSQSYVAIAAGEESDSDEKEFQAEISVTASGNWEFTNVPEWLTISPDKGEAGQSTVVFKAKKTTESRTAYIKLLCNGQEQEINVMQMAKKTDAPLSTCAEIIVAPDGKTYRAKGAVKSIANTTYGNWYLDDGTGEVYIYGTLDKAGAEKNFLSLGIEVGDIVTVEGPKTTYNGTVELVNVTVIAIEKSLIKVDSLDIADNTLPLEGGDFKAVLENKGNGVTVDIPEEAKDWLFVTGVDISGTTTVVSFRAAKNEGGDRSAKVTFVTTAGGKTYTSETTVTQKGAIVAATVAEFLAAEVGTTQYRMTGVITALYPSDKQGKSFYIRDYSGETLVYRAEGFIEAGAKVGDVVTVVGQRGAYKETPQMVSGTMEELKYAVTEVTIDEFLAKEDNPNVYYKVTGTVDEIANETYGNLYLKSGDTRLYVYGCYPGWGATGDARKNCLADKGIAVGDELTVIGVKSTYKEVPQVNGGIYLTHTKAE